MDQESERVHYANLPLNDKKDLEGNKRPEVQQKGKSVGEAIKQFIVNVKTKRLGNKNVQKGLL